MHTVIILYGQYIVLTPLPAVHELCFVLCAPDALLVCHGCSTHFENKLYLKRYDYILRYARAVRQYLDTTPGATLKGFLDTPAVNLKKVAAALPAPTPALVAAAQAAAVMAAPSGKYTIRAMQASGFCDLRTGHEKRPRFPSAAQYFA